MRVISFLFFAVFWLSSSVQSASAITISGVEFSDTERIVVSDVQISSCGQYVNTNSFLPVINSPKATAAMKANKHALDLQSLQAVTAEESFVGIDFELSAFGMRHVRWSGFNSDPISILDGGVVTLTGLDDLGNAVQLAQGAFRPDPGGNFEFNEARTTLAFEAVFELDSGFLKDFGIDLLGFAGLFSVIGQNGKDFKAVGPIVFYRPLDSSTPPGPPPSEIPEPATLLLLGGALSVGAIRKRALGLEKPRGDSNTY